VLHGKGPAVAGLGVGRFPRACGRGALLGGKFKPTLLAAHGRRRSGQGVLFLHAQEGSEPSERRIYTAVNATIKKTVCH
jgi:hypothetical protein